MPHEYQTPTVQVRKNDYLILGRGGVDTWIGGLFPTGVGIGGGVTRSDGRSRLLGALGLVGGVPGGKDPEDRARMATVVLGGRGLCFPNVAAGTGRKMKTGLALNTLLHRFPLLLGRDRRNSRRALQGRRRNETNRRGQNDFNRRVRATHLTLKC